MGGTALGQGIAKNSVSANPSRSNFQSSGLMIASNFKAQELSAKQPKRTTAMPPQYPASAQMQSKQGHQIMKGKGMADLYDQQ